MGMSASFESALTRELEIISSQDLLRHLRRIDSPQGPQIRVAETTFTNFSSNDYLGLANHPRLKAAAIEAIHIYGAGCGASRLVSGSCKIHHDLEETLADFKGTEAALSFSTGFAAAIGTIPSLLSSGDFLLVDRLVHACVIDAARMSESTLRVFPHNDMNRLEKLLQWCRGRQSPAKPASRILIVTESVFSMDGDFAPLKQLVELKEKYGAWLMVDEAHATGLFGAERRGRGECEGVGDLIEIQMGTLGKAVGASGGFIAGSRKLIDFLINKARSFIFSTAPAPASSAAAKAGLELIRSAEGGERCSRFLWNARQLDSIVRNQSANGAEPSPIIPLIIGGEQAALNLAGELRNQLLLVPAIRYPTVGKGKARLRFTITADHTPDQLVQLKTAMQMCREEKAKK